ncbi:MAG TPA: hypothetical protein VGH33_10525 [Isosphaeraceae bacterium]
MRPLAYHPRNPFRPPYWRSARARELHFGLLRARRIDDAWVRRARRVLAAVERFAGDLDHPRVAAIDKPVVAAYRLSLGDARLRLEIEARILSGQGDEAIASIVGLDVEVVESFGRLFWDVGPYLSAIDYIAAMVFGPALYRREVAGDVELAARLVGFTLGPVAVDIAFGRLAEGEGVARLSDDIGQFVALATAPATPATEPRWLALAGRLAELERGVEDGAAAPVSGAVEVDEKIAEESAKSVTRSTTSGNVAHGVGADRPIFARTERVIASLDVSATPRWGLA